MTLTAQIVDDQLTVVCHLACDKTVADLVKRVPSQEYGHELKSGNEASAYVSHREKPQRKD